jgi:hypothetical protein
VPRLVLPPASQPPDLIGLILASGGDIVAVALRDDIFPVARQIIKAGVDPKAGLSLGLELCKEYADFIAEVSKYHRKLKLEELNDTEFSGEPMRVKLLV